MIYVKDAKYKPISVPAVRKGGHYDKGEKKPVYLNVAAGFDIECSNYEIGEDRFAPMYIWQMQIGVDQPVYYGRTWKELQDFCKMLQRKYNLHQKRILPVYVHNLKYDFQSMWHYFKWTKAFAMKYREPTTLLCDYGIEFRDSLVLSGSSLEQTAKTLTKHKVRKLTGDVDHRLARHYLTPLTEAEMAYCENDVRIITAYIDEQIETYGDVTKIPMTNTGRVRRFTRQKCLAPGVKDYYKRLMKSTKLSAESYELCKLAYMGGFTHAAIDKVRKIHDNVHSYDFASSYPSVMMSEKFPMTSFKRLDLTPDRADGESEQDYRARCVVEGQRRLAKALKTKACLISMTMFNVSPKFGHEFAISISRCVGVEYENGEPKGFDVFNGRVVSADRIELHVTEVDFEIIQQCYNFDLYIERVYVADKDYLPRPILEAVLELYQDKTTLKGVKGKESEYLLKKGMLNSVYGMCVTRIDREEIVFENGEWRVEALDITESVERENNSRSRFLYYPWGVWIAAYARRNLWDGILELGKDYIYSDTDSIKFTGDHSEYIAKFNKEIVEKIDQTCKHYGFDPEASRPLGKQMGIWDYEGTYKHFKTLGAKQYIVQKQNGEFEITVAGLPKKAGCDYIVGLEPSEYAKTTKCPEMFNFNSMLKIPPNRSGKLLHTHQDIPVKHTITDYLGNSVEVECLSSTHLGEVGFKFGAQDDIALAEEIALNALCGKVVRYAEN